MMHLRVSEHTHAPKGTRRRTFAHLLGLPFIPRPLFLPRLLPTVTAGHNEGDEHRSEAAEGDGVHTKLQSCIINTARKVIPAGRGLNRGLIVRVLAHVNSHDAT